MTQIETDLGTDLGALLETHRRALTVHCYRFLGSLHDAEEATQETFLKAWRSRDTFRGEATVKTWLYRIATRVCLDLIDKRKRRTTPVLAGPSTRSGAPPDAAATEISWLEPIPADYFSDASLDPAAAYSMAESVKLAFIATLQTLPPRQRAVLILRDVLGWSAAETANALDMSPGAASSALHRARQRVAKTHHASGIDAVAESDLSDPGVIRLLDAYVRAWERDDIDGLVATLREDVRLAMPPSPSWFAGRVDVVEFLRTWIWPQGSYRLTPTSANAQPAYVMSLRGPDGAEQQLGIMVLTLSGARISAIDCFMAPDLPGTYPSD